MNNLQIAKFLQTLMANADTGSGRGNETVLRAGCMALISAITLGIKPPKQED